MSSSLDKVDGKGRPKAQCKLCSKWYHRVDTHLEKNHDGLTVKEYKVRFPRAEVYSPHAKSLMEAEAEAKVSDRSVKDFIDEEVKKAPKAEIKGKKVRQIFIDDPAEALQGLGEPEPPEVEEAGMFKIGTVKIKMRADLPPADLTHVPAHDPNWEIGDTEKERWEYLALAVVARENALLTGPTGCGKSESVQQLAAALNQPMRRINVHGDVRASDFIGDKTVDVDPASGQAIVRWVDGILPMCMRMGYWLLIDEIDAAPAHVLFVLQAVLEKHRLTIPATNETIQAHPDFRIIASANTLGKGDESGLYAGTHILNEAFLDRFGVVITCAYPSLETEVNIIVRRTNLNREDARKMVEVARDVRRAQEAESCYCTFSTRRLVAWADKAVRLGNARRAARITVSNRLSSEDAKFVDGLIQRVWGSK